MCGIFGSIRLDTTTNSDAPLVLEGVELLKHRGPDGLGVETRGPVCFGHTRLSIIDPSGGHQPMVSNDGRGAITYNGEVYNYRDVRSELETLGYRFDTRSDTEVLLYAYLEWGRWCLEKFRGMFAFAVADLASGTVMLARDRVGKKPLFYTIRQGTFFFASELEPLYRVCGPFKIDMEAVDEYLYWQYIAAPRTIYQDVVCLPPAHVVEIDLESGGVECSRYWELVFRQDRSLAADEWEERLDHTIREAVEVRLVSDVPYGAFLSGGIDSSLVVGYMSEILSEPVRTFSIGFKNADYSELAHADAAAGICGTEHHTEIVEAESLKILALLVRHYGQPFADSSAIPTYYVSQMAGRYVKMVLSGDGGDENFAGYNTYEHILSRLNGSPAWASEGGRRLLRSAARLYWKLRSRAARERLLEDAFHLHCNLYSHFLPEQRRNLFKARYRSLVCEEADARMALISAEGEPLVSRLQLLDIRTYLPYDILTKVDIASMANSLEVRAPLLDHKLMEAVATMPPELKLKREKVDRALRYDKKHILKKLAYRRYPREMIDRPKQGFGLPLGDWFSNELRKEVEDRLLGSDMLPLLFEVAEIERIIRTHSTRTDMSPRLWNLLFLDEWMRTHSESLSGL
jgi:asparagine synthase (glutamine-hydrolysing)